MLPAGNASSMDSHPILEGRLTHSLGCCSWGCWCVSHYYFVLVVSPADPYHTSACRASMNSVIETTVPLWQRGAAVATTTQTAVTYGCPGHCNGSCRGLRTHNKYYIDRFGVLPWSSEMLALQADEAYQNSWNPRYAFKIQVKSPAW